MGGSYYIIWIYSAVLFDAVVRLESSRGERKVERFVIKEVLPFLLIMLS